MEQPEHTCSVLIYFAMASGRANNQQSSGNALEIGSFVIEADLVLPSEDLVRLAAFDALASDRWGGFLVVTVHNWLDDAPSDDEVGEEQQEEDEGDTLNSPDPAPAPNVIEVLYDSDGLYYRARVHKSWHSVVAFERGWARALRTCAKAARHMLEHIGMGLYYLSPYALVIGIAMLAPRFLASAPLGLTGANPILAASLNLPSISPNNALPFFPVMGELELQNIEVTIGEAACSESTTIWDTGAAKNMTNKIEDLEPSSIERAPVAALLAVAVGSDSPDDRVAVAAVTCRFGGSSVETYGDQPEHKPEHNGYGVLNLPDTILNERCAFKLVAACEVKRTHGVSLSLPANGDAFVQFKNGARTKLLGDRVLLVPCANMSDIRATQLLNAQVASPLPVI